MIFEGTYEIKAPREKVWDFLIDPHKIGKCLSDLKSLEVQDEDRFTAVMKVGIGFIKGDFKFRLSITEKNPLSNARLKGTGTGSGSTIDFDTLIDLSEIPVGTRVNYKADVKVGGAMASLAQRMIGGATDKTISQVFECLKTQLEG